MGRGDDATEAYGFDTVEDAGQGVEPGALVGEYRIEGELGAGGMGRVYAAIHPVIAKRAAIKVLHPELSRDPAAVERFVREARVVNEIGHPNIVDIFAFGTLADGRNYFVMEQLRGESLKARMQRARLSLDEVRAVLATIATALEAAHKVGVVHRDLKPDNVFLVDVEDAPAPLVKLLDFGIAKLLVDDRRLERTETGAFMGTPAYISPEQARGENVDHRTDIYALGVMAFELLTGRLPFTGTSVAEVVAKHLMEAPPSMCGIGAQVPEELDAMVGAMLAKEPSQRPTLAEIRARLRALPSRPAQTAAAGAAETQPAFSAVHPIPSRRVPVARLAIGVAIVAAAGIAAYVIVNRGTTPPATETTASPSASSTAPAPAPTPAPPAPVAPAPEPEVAPQAAAPEPDASTAKSTTPPPKRVKTQKRTKATPPDPVPQGSGSDRDGLM
jgi:serine/threonine-protein kinase